MNLPLRPPVRMVACTLLLGLSACASVGSYSSTAPGGTAGLAGIWVLNPSLSTDTRKALADLAPKPPRGRRGEGPGPGASDSGPVPGDAGGGPGGAGPGDGQDGGPVDQGPSGQDGGRRRGGRGGGGGGGGGEGGMQYQGGRGAIYRPPLDLQQDALAGGEWLKITRRQDDMVIANAAGSHSYTPGEHSVISVQTGVADQSTGWKGRDYVVEVKPQVGPHYVERYALSADGRQLTVRIQIDSEGPNKAMKVIRVYDHADAIPQQAPSEQQPPGRPPAPGTH